MPDKIAPTLNGPRPTWTASLAARALALWHRSALPPGDLIPLDLLEKHDRMRLLDLAAVHGPVFKAMSDGRLLVCVVGLALGRRLLKEHASALRPVTLDLESLFPQGFLRQMEGESHRDMRRALMRAVQAADIAAYAPDLERIACESLSAYTHGAEQHRGARLALASALSRLASGLLVRVFFGAEPGSQRFDRLMDGFTALGPHGLVWNVGPRQTQAFGALRDELRAQAATLASQPGSAFASGLFGHLEQAGPVDDSLLGNLIYMVEMGRYDLRGLLRWICKYAAEQPAWLERIALEPDAEPGPQRSVAEAFVLETLRMDQSERLLRTVKRDIHFERFLIPRGSMLRICLWEAHKSPDNFARAFEFDLGRFLGGAPSGDQFAPFGLDHHQCPFATLSVRLGVVFLRALARSYRISSQGAGPAVRGAYHWEPASELSFTLQPRSPVNNG